MRVTRASTDAALHERHHVGHGIGLEPYDPPTINAATHTALGQHGLLRGDPYYEHGWGGVRSRTPSRSPPAVSPAHPVRARSWRFLG